MNIIKYKEITTEEHLVAIAKESESYNGLYVDMNIPEQRKYVKQKAATIKYMLKEVDHLRISNNKSDTLGNNAAAKYISDSLQKSNDNFTLLIDDYNAERKLVLDAEKQCKADIEAAVNKENDHEYAILLDKSYLADKLAAEKAQAEHDEAIRVDATNRASDAAKRAQEVTDEAIKQDTANRLANDNHVRKINRAIYQGFIDAGMEKDAATIATQALIDSKIPHTIINY